jgi:hypothetical protein
MSTNVSEVHAATIIRAMMEAARTSETSVNIQLRTQQYFLGTITFITFKFLHFFSFFFCSHSRKGGAQLVSQHVMTEIVYYYVTPVHNASLSI